MMKVLVLILLFSTACYAQEESNVYFEKKINKVETYFENILKNNRYIIYSTPYTMHLILEREDNYFHFIFESNYDEDFMIKCLNLIEEKEGKKIFNKNKYEKGVINIKSEFYKENPIESINGLPTFFSYNTDFQKRYCEYYLAVGIKPVPMDFETYQYLGSILLDIPDLR